MELTIFLIFIFSSHLHSQQTHTESLVGVCPILKKKIFVTPKIQYFLQNTKNLQSLAHKTP